MNSRIFRILALTIFACDLGAAEYFVNKRGRDANSGLSESSSFMTIQKGLDVLRPGDVLTIGPGEYLESIRRDELGDAEQRTTIRARIPGAVVLRGDAPIGSFRQVDGYRFVYVTEFDRPLQVQTVNELDTLKIFERSPNIAGLEFKPGAFLHDMDGGKLYISTSDMEPPDAHRYSASILPSHGLYLSNAKNVTVEGLSFSGFNSGKPVNYREGTYTGVWGAFVFNGKGCVIRDCRSWLNGWGIGLNSSAKTSGDNRIERCAAWGNVSPFTIGDCGGLTIFSARRDAISDSVAFLNGEFGINIYLTGTDGGTYGAANVAGNEEWNKSRLSGNLSWGNGLDYKIKTGVAYHHLIERCVGLGRWHVAGDNAIHCLIGDGHGKKRPPSDIVLSAEKNLDPDAEFANPTDHDYRLQATSRFRKAMPDGGDPGPFPYQPNVFYLAADGDDKNDGLSTKYAWRTLKRAVGNLHPGDTLYLLPGIYAGGLDLRGGGEGGAPISIRGRGRGPVVIQGESLITGGGAMKFSRLRFEGTVRLDGMFPAETAPGGLVAFENCWFMGSDVGLKATSVSGLRVTHCLFMGDEKACVALKNCANAFLNGNIYDNAAGPALRVNDLRMVEYSDYNSYRRKGGAWSVNGRPLSFNKLQDTHDRHSHELVPEFAKENGVVMLRNAASFAAKGPWGTPLGPCFDEAASKELRLISRPRAHALSATTANLEWRVSAPATCVLAWGRTPKCVNTSRFDVNYFGTYSLTGLEPGATYYFRIKSLSVPTVLRNGKKSKSVELSYAPISFSTLKSNSAPVTYHVAPDGNDANTGLDRQHAWRTIQRAANGVNVGDTVLIAGGRYAERVVIRATGAVGAPITFRCAPGEKVFMDGDHKTLRHGFIVGGKQHLRFDGMYFKGFNLFFHDWPLMDSGEFLLYDCADIAISRCFSDGRGGYSPGFIRARDVKNLRIDNCVIIYKLNGSMFEDCPDLRIKNTVFAAPMVLCFALRNDKDQTAIMENNIFTDMQAKKANLNIGLFCVDRKVEPLRQKNNCYLLRRFPPEKRSLINRATYKQTEKNILDPLFADPQFAGDPGNKGNPKDKSGYAPDRFLRASLRLDFNSFFATNPKVVERGLGLSPEAFDDFKFGGDRDSLNIR